MFYGLSFITNITFSISFSFFLGQHLWHMEVPRLGVALELQLLVYATATATQDLSHVCNPHPQLMAMLDP